MNPTKPHTARTASPAAVPSSASASNAATSRKPWIKKTPVEIVLEQIGKQEQKVAGMREELAREERELSKLEQARKVLEST
jgi:hypothetical protein